MIIQVLLWVIGVVALTMGIYTLVDYSSEDKSIPLIKFDRFITFFNINPKRWYLSSYSNSVGFYPEGRITTTDFRFNFIDYYFRYKPFLRSYSKQNRRRKNEQVYNKSYTILLEEMTKEVDKLKTKSDRELSQVYSNIQSILDRKR